MAKKVKFVLNKAGLISLFTSPEVNGWLQEVGDSVASSASGSSSGEYAARAHNASRTAIVNVYPDDEKAARDNYKNNTLLKALGASGLPRTKPKL